LTKPHYVMTKPHHVMTKPHHVMINRIVASNNI
jgi:hypothetical protein